MKTSGILLFLGLILSLSSFYFIKKSIYEVDESRMITYQVDVEVQDLKFYWKNSEEKKYSNFQNLKRELNQQNQKLIFAMNGGMYLKDGSPQGLFIEDGEIKKSVNAKNSNYGNFYMKPNGVFCVTNENTAVVCETSQIKNINHIKYATQSGPMLLNDGEIHSQFILGSKNLHIRNGVGILPNGKVLFAMSKEKINFYDFATFFKQRGCRDALYLDGFVSRMYVPSKNWNQQDGNFGVIIGVVE
jgi:uncharacterized protein YigE (DUF2233 family)